MIIVERSTSEGRHRTTRSTARSCPKRSAGSVRRTIGFGKGRRSDAPVPAKSDYQEENGSGAGAGAPRGSCTRSTCSSAQWPRISGSPTLRRLCEALAYRQLKDTCTTSAKCEGGWRCNWVSHPEMSQMLWEVQQGHTESNTKKPLSGLRLLEKFKWITPTVQPSDWLFTDAFQNVPPRKQEGRTKQLATMDCLRQLFSVAKTLQDWEGAVPSNVRQARGGRQKTPLT